MSNKPKKENTYSNNSNRVSSKGNMYELSLKQWNPFMGCSFDCIYCKDSFQRQAKRQKQRCLDCYNYSPHTHPDRLNASLPNTKKDEFIFTCASGDISFCPTDFLNKIIMRIKRCPQKTFLIQSKNPETFNRVVFPDNVILGITLETNRDAGYEKVCTAPVPSVRFNDFLNVNHTRKMVTIEPVMEFDHRTMLSWIRQLSPQMVWMGYDSKNEGLFPEPKLDKFMILYNAIGELGIKVKLKTVRE